MNFKLLPIVTCILFFSSCASNPNYRLRKPKQHPESKVKISKSNQLKDSVKRKFSVPKREKNSLSVEVPFDKDKNSEIKLVINDSVKWWIDYFSKKDHKRFQRFLNRGYYYKEVVQTILEENGLPSELYYLAMIESGFVKSAKSHAKAVGTWQFMKGTGKSYGLKVNRYLDERKDPIRSTEAASKYLKDLYTAFGNWELAMAAYNCGEHRLLRSVMRGNSRDYWVLKKKLMIPKETRNYVPKFMAAIHIGQNPEIYGFKNPAKLTLSEFPDVEAVPVPGATSLKTIARHTGIDYKFLRKVNFHLKKGITPPNKSSYEIWIPKGKRSSLTAVNKVLRKYKIKNTYSADNYYRVKKGDNLSSISKKYKESVSYLKRLNNLKTNNIFVGQKLRIKAKSYSRVGKSSYYFVKRGDNLSKISQKFRISLTKLKSLNKLSNNKIYTGQKLKISNNSIKYRVQKGDNLFKIANKFNVSIRDLKIANNLSSSKILIGQILKI